MFGEIDDLALWKEIIKNIKPLKALNKKTSNMRPSKLKITEQPAHLSTSYSLNNKEHELASQAGLDKNLRKRMDNGSLPIEGILDLHGLGINQAFGIFTAFIEKSFAQNKRMLLVITGKGYKSANGVSAIKSELPNWLNDENLRGKILRFTFARAKHGGEGAFYILLKRKR